MVSLKVDLGLSGGGVDGTFISAPNGAASTLAIVAQLNGSRVIV